MYGITCSRIPASIASLSAVLIIAACAKPTRQAQPAVPQPPRGVETSASSIAEARADSARYPYTAADIHFMSAMIAHHSQALSMAGWASTHNAGAAVRRLAERIINGQQDEIATMQQWLRDRNQPVPQTMAAPLKMSGHGNGHGTHMPGMLTEAQMMRLDQSRGADFDRLFLTLMIQHHRGALSMVRDLFGSYGAAQDETVFKFASDVNVDQSTEIARMEKMLDALAPIRKSQP